MKKLSFLMMLLFTYTAFSQAVFVVQGTSGQSAHASLQAAVDAAADGDYIYMPGGTFNIGDFDITKRLNLIGAGHYPDSTVATGITALTGNLFFSTGSSHSMIQGVYISGKIQMGKTDSTGNVNNILVSRCNVNELFLSPDLYQNFGAENIFIRETIVRGNINGANTQGVVIENCILVGLLTYLNGNANVNNCIFLRQGNDFSANAFSYVFSTNFNNCIFRTPFASTIQGGQNIYNNCVFRTSSFPFGTHNNSLFNKDFGPLFVNVNGSSDVFSYNFDYHLAANSPARGHGLQGTDCGIYGGDNPYKESAVPVNPHIQFKQIPTSTNNQGKLNIQIKSAAQEN